jgi:hypothetical protein
MAKKGEMVMAVAEKMPAKAAKPKGKSKSLPRVVIEGADNGVVIVTVDKNGSNALDGYAPPEKHVFASYADAESLIEAQFGGKD